jgi:anaerobic ribonucleoside-triphosphate reductase
MLVVKRDGRSEAFDGSRIERAVLRAMREVGRGDGDAWAASVRQEVEEILRRRGVERVHVEEIQDLVELSLMRDRAIRRGQGLHPLQEGEGG